MIRNLAAMTASQLKRDSRDEKKKSMLLRLSPEAGKLFDLLAARDWDDENPKMSRSMRDLVSDRDSQRALAIIKTQTKRWSGLVSEKGLLGFFANGFAANEIQESPGGFTIFMFKPLTAIHTKDKKKAGSNKSGQCLAVQSSTTTLSNTTQKTTSTLPRPSKDWKSRYTPASNA
jgi:hypothetical protein